MRWPPKAKSQPPHWRAFMTYSKSPSKITLSRPRSSEKRAALLAASSSKTSTVGGFLIFSAKAALTSPTEFRTTTPIPASPNSLNIAPSKLIFHSLPTGGLQTFGAEAQTVVEHLLMDLKARTVVEHGIS